MSRMVQTRAVPYYWPNGLTRRPRRLLVVLRTTPPPPRPKRDLACWETQQIRRSADPFLWQRLPVFTRLVLSARMIALARRLPLQVSTPKSPPSPPELTQ
jgi:hypothetical protein